MKSTEAHTAPSPQPTVRCYHCRKDSVPLTGSSCDEFVTPSANVEEGIKEVDTDETNLGRNGNGGTRIKKYLAAAGGIYRDNDPGRGEQKNWRGGMDGSKEVRKRRAPPPKGYAYRTPPKRTNIRKQNPRKPRQPPTRRKYRGNRISAMGFTATMCVWTSAVAWLFVSLTGSAITVETTKTITGGPGGPHDHQLTTTEKFDGVEKEE